MRGGVRKVAARAHTEEEKRACVRARAHTHAHTRTHMHTHAHTRYHLGYDADGTRRCEVQVLKTVKKHAELVVHYRPKGMATADHHPCGEAEGGLQGGSTRDARRFVGPSKRRRVRVPRNLACVESRGARTEGQRDRNHRF